MNLNPYRIVTGWFRSPDYREAVRAGGAAAVLLIAIVLILTALDASH